MRIPRAGSRPLLKTFSQSLKRFSIGPSDKIIVAVSGGPDSVCLLHLLLEVYRQSEIGGQPRDDGSAANRLHVAHLNHAFRPEADSEAEFVSKLCRSWGIPGTIEKWSVLEQCKDKRLSKQEKARLVRYAFLRQVAAANRARWIALGHTADDQAETFLVNLLRGAGGEGLSGIPASREEGACVIVRPMLSVTRREILTELQEAQIPFVEDRSNRDKRFLRNRVRHELIPLLQTYNPNMKETLLREANLLEEESHFLKAHLADLLPKLTSRVTRNEVCFDLPLFCASHLAVQRRLIRWAIGHLRGGLKDVGFHQINGILTKISGDKNIKSVFLTMGISVKKNGTSLLLQTGSPVPSRSILFPTPFEIPKHLLETGTGAVMGIDLPPWKIRLWMSIKDHPPSTLGRGEEIWGTRGEFPAHCFAFLDFDTIPLPLAVRGWRAGDRFIPLGMKGGHKKLQDFFVDVKVPRERRDQTPLLVCPTGIVWVIGYRISTGYRITEKTKTILSLRVETMGKGVSC